MSADGFALDVPWDADDVSSSSSSNSSSGNSPKQVEVATLVLNNTILSTSIAFIIYSSIQLVRIHILSVRITRQQQDRARATAAAGMNSVAGAPVRFVGKSLFHIFVIISMAFKAAAVALELFGPCDPGSTWPYYGRYCWPMLEAFFRVQNILLFLAYFDTFICWSDYLHSATSLLYGTSWGRNKSSAGSVLRSKTFLNIGGVILSVMTAVYVALLFVLHQEDSSEDTVAADLDLGAVTFVGVLYTITAIGIGVQCFRFISLTQRVRKSTASTVASGRRRAHSGGVAVEGSLGSNGSNPSLSASVDGDGGSVEGPNRIQSDKLKLGAMFALIITCSVLLVIRAIWPVLVWLFMMHKLAFSDWYSFGEHILCEVVPLMCMFALVFPLPNENDVVGNSNGGSRIIVGTSVLQTSDDNKSIRQDSFSAVTVDGIEERQGSVNSIYHSVDDMDSDSDEDDGNERRTLLPQVASR